MVLAARHIALWNRIKGTKKSSHLWPNDFQQICQDPPMGIGQSFQQMLLERLNIHIQNNEVGPYLTP